MTDRKDQPAQLKRRIALLEGQLAAEKARAEKAWDAMPLCADAPRM